MKTFLPIAVVIALTASGAALADDDCHRPWPNGSPTKPLRPV
jgi:hypothetical protein